ncbi:MAG: hypothetical protein AAFN80_03660 [Pseudomonadota bacterium]
MSGLIKKYAPQIGYIIFPNLRRELIGSGEAQNRAPGAPVSLLVKAHYHDDPDALFAKASSFADVMHVTRRIAKYKHLPPVRMERGKTYTTDIRVFGVFRYANYKIRIDHMNPLDRVLITHEGNRDVRSWKHRVDVKSSRTGAVWTDYLEIDAGFLTPLACLFARFMYVHRHKQRGAVTTRSVLGEKATKVHDMAVKDNRGFSENI